MDQTEIKKKYNSALKGLQENTRLVHGFNQPVLCEGGVYAGIWQECGPLEGLVYAKQQPKVALSSHEIFFHHQRDDGYIPCWINANAVGSHSIQMVVPIAATSLELAELLKNESFLAKAYQACSDWDAWLSRNRNTRGTGLCEAFCHYDTGHDGSPRFDDKGMPWECPDNDASKPTHVMGLPYLAPDLSANVYGARVALSKMAEHLDKGAESQMWLEKSEHTRALILKHCYDPEDECFYDVDAEGNFVRVRGDILTRIFGEHVVDQATFDRIYQRHIKNPESFWTPYPLPSIAADDPAFIKHLPKNSWGGASQALTALRTPRWFNHYGKTDDHQHLMERWVEAILKSPAFMQQMNPWTGEFSTSEGYSPSMLVFIDFVDRLGLLKSSTTLP